MENPIKVSTTAMHDCPKDSPLFTLSFESKRHITMSAHDYEDGAEVTMFSVSTEDMETLALALLNTAWRLRRKKV